MELMRDLDPEEARALVDPALKIMVDAVRRYEGYTFATTRCRNSQDRLSQPANFRFWCALPGGQSANSIW
jgi:hypothetical protein